ncbi:SRPBCC family protein [Chitinophaga nivalis]|uniref:SRPBCC domain-containing protein n=1 Tax=Chitinophaga nivalis TaxID=2991709 RepID=A0ABT3ILG0_9BACT|nr:SRPBCC domain-containing protein [Chitinophaga nivalis]MCW3465509.1 SRPBCC domain-containing protein [Chitinophaga nivalis]MCW3484800.1 SRPBCC domain-containing protein [Chitinophaga nivalis]
METIYHQVWIQATPDKVYAAITQPDGLAKWWEPPLQARPEEGFICTFDAGLHGTHQMKITDLRPLLRVEWECLPEIADPRSPLTEWEGTYISFEQHSEKGVVILDFRHSGWMAQTPHFGLCSFHWARHLGILKHYCETGESLMDPEAEAQLRNAVLLNKR